jgi:hypothetical protein
MNENGNMSTLDQAIQMLRALEAEADAEVEHHLELLASARAAQRRVKAMLKASGIGGAAPSPKKKRQYGPSEEMIGRVLDAIFEHVRTREAALPDVPGSFTIGNITELAGVHSTSVINSIHALRDQGRLRKVGVISGAQGTPPPVYALDEDYRGD